MPSLIRFLALVGIVAGFIWIGMLALVSFVEPEQREMSAPVSANRLNK